jgi:hypothetical protein
MCFFNDAISSSDIIPWNVRMITEICWKGWKEAVVAEFEVISWNLSGET